MPGVGMPFAIDFLSILALRGENPLHKIAGGHYTDKIESILIHLIRCKYIT